MSADPRTTLPSWLVILLLLPAAAWSAPASEWKDAKGTSFRGEPVETAGPVALFRTGPWASRFVPLRSFSVEDCVRFHQAIAHRAPRAQRWSEARGEATAPLVGRLRRTVDREVRPVDFAAIPEPEMIIGVFIGRRDADLHYLLDNLGPFCGRVQRVYPGRVVAAVFVSPQANLDPRWLPARSWLVADRSKLGGIPFMTRFTPAEGLNLVLMTREGVPLFGCAASGIRDVMTFVDGAADFLWELNPANPRAVRDRAHYLKAVRPVLFADGEAPPVLMLDPLRADALRARGVKAVEARLSVDAAGMVTGAELRPGDGVPGPLARPVAEALRRSAFFLPAISRGQAVAGAHDYRLELPPQDAQLAADAAWVQGEARAEVPIKSWLVLKHVKVGEQVFSTVDSIGPDGTVMLKAVTAGSGKGGVSTASQVNAFNSDWFESAGAGSVRPVAGQAQEVDGEKLVWRVMKPDHGLVDFLGNARNLDFCIGYAWTEVEVAADTDGWLGIGSDDGLKVWVNGELVNDKWVRRTSRLDDDVVPVRLRQGRNAILIKIQNAMGLWSFTCRLRVRGA